MKGDAIKIKYWARSSSQVDCGGKEWGWRTTMRAGEQSQEGPGLIGLSKGRTVALLVGLGLGG